jgi:hypothetical protein
MTSESSKDRLDFIFRDYGLHHFYRYNGFFCFRIVFSKYSTIPHIYEDNKSIFYLSTPCHDFVHGPLGLICRVSYSQSKFPNDIPWHFRAMDDTYLNLDNLHRLIEILEKIYNPYEEIVFRAFANYLFNPTPYIGGGSGWLMSNAFVTSLGHEIPSLDILFNKSFQHQDDTTMYIIVSNIFDKVDQWNDAAFIDPGFSNTYSKAKNCNLYHSSIFQLNQGVSFHVDPYSYNQNRESNNKGSQIRSFFKNSTPNSYQFKISYSNYSTIACFGNSLSKTLTLEYENRSYKRVRPNDFHFLPLSHWNQKLYTTTVS